MILVKVCILNSDDMGRMGSVQGKVTGPQGSDLLVPKAKGSCTRKYFSCLLPSFFL